MKETRTTLIITGMHRSGTSLLANFLHHAGYAMGDLLVGPDTGNIEGHYEDWDFVHYHNDLLRFNDLDYLADERLAFDISDYFHLRAESLIKLKNNLHSNWGWKDPRSSLFLNLWHQKTVNPRYIFVIRPYAEIAESLFQRELNKLRSSKVFQLKKLLLIFHKKKWIKRFILSYINHNKRIISFCQQLPKEQYLVLSRSTFIENHDAFFQYLNNNWNLDLKENPFEKIYKDELAHKLSNSKYQHIAAKLVEQTLKQLETESMERILNFHKK